MKNKIKFGQNFMPTPKRGDQGCSYGNLMKAYLKMLFLSPSKAEYGNKSII